MIEVSKPGANPRSLIHHAAFSVETIKGILTGTRNYWSSKIKEAEETRS